MMVKIVFKEKKKNNLIYNRKQKVEKQPYKKIPKMGGKNVKRNKINLKKLLLAMDPGQQANCFFLSNDYSRQQSPLTPFFETSLFLFNFPFSFPPFLYSTNSFSGPH